MKETTILHCSCQQDTDSSRIMTGISTVGLSTVDIGGTETVMRNTEHEPVIPHLLRGKSRAKVTVMMPLRHLYCLQEDHDLNQSLEKVRLIMRQQLKRLLDRIWFDSCGTDPPSTMLRSLLKRIRDEGCPDGAPSHSCNIEGSLWGMDGMETMECVSNRNPFHMIQRKTGNCCLRNGSIRLQHQNPAAALKRSFRMHKKKI